LKSRMEEEDDLERRPIPAKDKIEGIPKRKPAIEVMRFACNVWECRSLGLTALTRRTRRISDLKPLSGFNDDDRERRQGINRDKDDNSLEEASNGAIQITLLPLATNDLSNSER